MRVNSQLLCGVATAAFMVCLAEHAVAADAAAATDAASVAPVSTTVPAILVTAERREESLQKVAVSVTAGPSAQIPQLLIHNLAARTTISPTFTIRGVGAVNRSGAVVYSRGIGFQGSGGVAPPIAISIDG